jgi:hypothetical protein
LPETRATAALTNSLGASGSPHPRYEYVGDTLRERSGLTLTDEDIKKARATYLI